MRVAFAVSGASAADVTTEQRTNIAQAVARAAGVQASAATVSVDVVQFGTDSYSTASAYSNLATKVLVYCDLQLATADEARRARAELANSLSSQGALQSLLGVPQQPGGIEVLEPPTISASTDPPGGGANGKSDGGGLSGGAVAAIVIVLLVLLAGGGAYWYFHQPAGGKQQAAQPQQPSYEISSAAPPPPGPPPPPAASALPHGWTEHKDPNSGATYYVNGATGESSWNKPSSRV